MIPRNYSEAQSELEKRRVRKEKRLTKRLSSAKCVTCGSPKDHLTWCPGEVSPIRSKSTAKGSRRRPKSPSRAKLEKEAWDAFSLYIRERDKDNGCISCGGSVSQAGHMISRRRRATKYDEINVNGQCGPCNWKDKFMPGYHDHCVSKFIERHGLAVYTGLVLHSKDTVQHGKDDMVAIRGTYREKLLTLKASRAQQAEDDRMQR